MAKSVTDDTKDENEKPAITKAIVPSLKNVHFKRGRLQRFVSNYAENVTDVSQFFVTKQRRKKKDKLTLDEREFVVEREAEREVQEEEKKIKSKKKKKWLNFIYFALNLLVIAIVLVTQLSGEQNPFESLTAILDVNWWFILAACGTIVVGMLCDQMRFGTLIHKTTCVYRFNLAFKVGVLGRYYDTITPFSTGGQPFQVIYMNRYGIKPGAGISVTVAKYIFAQLMYFGLATYFMFTNFSSNYIDGTSNVATGVATTFTWVGYIICAVVIIFVIFISFNRRVGAGIVVAGLKVLSKIKIGKFRLIKDYNKSFRNVMNTVSLWHRTTQKYSKSFGVIFVNTIFSALFLFSSYSMPYFIYCAFVGWHPEMWLRIMAIALMVDLTSAFNPIPMGTGTADLSFTAFYAVVFAQAGLGAGAQVWALIIWRCLNYYVHILNGFLLLTYDYAVGNKRLEKNKEIWLHTHKERRQMRMQQKMQNEQMKQK
jgi:uncharacterized protein (TIRG00374 family)